MEANLSIIQVQTEDSGVQIYAIYKQPEVASQHVAHLVYRISRDDEDVYKKSGWTTFGDEDERFAHKPFGVIVENRVEVFAHIKLENSAMLPHNVAQHHADILSAHMKSAETADLHLEKS